MLLAPNQTVHWFRVLTDLRMSGLSLDAIGKRIGGVPRERISGWLNIGCQPRHDDGERLIVLWEDLMHLDRSDVPVVDRNDWRL